MSEIRTLFFDLDGTLTDSAEGIVNCFEYALERCGGKQYPRAELQSHIGSSLRRMFAELLETDDTERVEEAVVVYRERYARVGMLDENKLYDGIPEVLDRLQEQGLKMFVATSKAVKYAKVIVDHFGISKYFVNVYGAGDDGKLDDKAVLLAHAALNEGIVLSSSMMIGDKHHDINAAKKNAVKSLGVLYGYGSRIELLTAGADYMCKTPEEIYNVVLSTARLF